MAKALSLIGNRYERLLVIERAPNIIRKDGSTRSAWKCLCDCGSEIVVMGSNLVQDNTKSCGCFKIDGFAARVLRHGHRRRTEKIMPEYVAWTAMKQRCGTSTRLDFKHYGGRGIRVCDRWLNNFGAFLADMGLRPSSHHSIDRIDNDGNYEPGNCRWATRSEQTRNTRSNIFLRCRDEWRTIAEWAEIGGVSHNLVRVRVLRRDWDVERAISTPPLPIGRPRKQKAA